MMANFDQLKQWIDEMALLISRDAEPDPHHYTYFLQEPALATQLIDLIDGLAEHEVEEEQAYYSACVFALDICVAQLQIANESGNKLALKTLNQLMTHLADALAQGNHSLSFWLPILNAFYDVHVELSPELKNAYLELAGQEDELVPEGDEGAHLSTIRDMIIELDDLSIYDIAENFFAQSYAMPPDFFVDLVIDLYSIEEGQDIALLTLLHPKHEVREVVISTLDQLMPNLTLSSASLSRLQVIAHWYPASYHPLFNRWIKEQRLKGVVFSQENPTPPVKIKASEVDGSGSQGIFVHLKNNRKNRLCGLLFKQDIGIKDAWVTVPLSVSEVNRCYRDAFEDNVTLREVDSQYLLRFINHFLALTIERGAMPDLHLLEIQELLSLPIRPQRLDCDALLEQLSVQITPFTEQELYTAFKRSKLWPKKKQFAELWYTESAQIDKLVNRCCSFVEGAKICRYEEAIHEVLHHMEGNRQYWLFHFLWLTLWLKSKARKNESHWKDSFFIAYAMQNDTPFAEIPIMHAIANETIVNSLETMQERRTYLN